MRKYLFISFLLLNLLKANSQQFLFKTLDVEDGLNQSTVEYITQDKYGFLWVATQHGLNKYDGYNFKKYIANPHDSTTFKFPFVRTMFVDSDGDIVSLMENELIIFDYSKGIFRYYKHPEINISDYTDEVEGVLIHQDEQGFYWLSVSQVGYLIFDKKTKQFLPFSFPDVDGFHIVKSTKFIIDKNNMFWTIALKDEMMYSASFDIADFHKTGVPKYTFHPINIKYDRTQYRTMAYYLLNNEKYLTIRGSAALKYNNKTNSWKILDNEFWNYFMNLKGEINDICSDGNNIWIATQMKGLFIIDKNYKLVKHVMPNDNAKSIGSIDVQNLFLDNTGVMWIGTTHGLSYIDLNRKPFIEISEATGLLGNDLVSAIEIDNKNQLWVSTRKGLSIFSSNFLEHEYITYNNKLKHIYPQQVTDMEPYKDNTMFLVRTGLVKINYKKHIYQYAHPTKGDSTYGSWGSWNIHKGKATNIYWFSTFNGLTKLIPDNYPVGKIGELAIMPEKFFTYRQFKDGKKQLHSSNIWCTYETHDSVLWIGTIDGLSIFDIKTEEFKLIEHKTGSDKNIGHPKIKCIYEDSKNRIWVGSEGGGINQMDKEGNNIKTFNTQNGLCSDIIWGILEDNNGKLWISTTNGLSRFDPENETFKNFYKSHGLPSVEFQRGAYCKGKNGKLYFGTSKGVVAFYPDSIKINSIPPKVIISQLFLFNKPVKIDEEINGDIILNKCIQETKEIVLSHENNVISIEFTGIHFPAPEHIKYKYKLEGFDNEWNYTNSNQRKAHYTNLPHGKYTFKVKAANYDGVWSDETASMVLVKILPPFWKTWWFRILVIILLVFIISMLFRYRIRSLKNRQIELESQVKERTQEIQMINEELRTQSENLQETNVLLEERQEEVITQNEEISIKTEELQKLNATKDKFFSIIAHDLKNPFHAITGFSSILKKSFSDITDEKKIEFIGMIEQSSKSVSSLLENLLTWSRSQTNKVKYLPKVLDIKEIVDETVNLLKLNAEAKSISLSSKIKNKTIAYCDSNMITTVIRNITSNAIKFTPEKGKISISADKVDEKLEITIKDNGVGMKPETIQKLFQVDKQHSTHGTSGEGGTGLGLIICKEFVEKNGGHIKS